jgi:hypothetical protein
MAINQLTTANTFQQWVIATQGLITVANTLTDGNGNTFIANTKLEISGAGATLNVKNTATINVLNANTITTTNLIVTNNLTNANITNKLAVGSDAIVYGEANIISKLTVGSDAIVQGNANIIGDLTVTGNLILDDIGFDDLTVAGNGTFGNTLTVVGATSLSNLTLSGNVQTLNVSTDAYIGDDLIVYGDTEIKGNLLVTGNLTLDNIGFDDLSVAGSGEFGNNLTVFGNTNLNTLTGNANTTIFNSIAQAQQDAESTSLAFSIALG